jgi:hypothetical protein
MALLKEAAWHAHHHLIGHQGEMPIDLIADPIIAPIVAPTPLLVIIVIVVVVALPTLAIPPSLLSYKWLLVIFCVANRHLRPLLTVSWAH